MRVLIVGINFHPELTGIGKYTGELAAYLDGRGHQIRVITTPPYYPHWQVQPGYRGWQYRQEKWQGVWVFRCPLWVPRRLSGIKRLLHLLSFALTSFPVLLGQCSWRPNLILCIAPTFFNAPFALFTARLSGAKAWLHIQDFELDVLQGCEDILNKFSHLYIECSFIELYEGQVLAHQIIAWLEQRNFLLCGVHNLYYERNGRAIQGDFLFSLKK